MLLWLILILAILGGLFLALGGSGTAPEMLPHWAVAVAVLLTLLLLYAISSRGFGQGIGNSRRASGSKIVAMALAIAAGFFLMRESHFSGLLRSIQSTRPEASTANGDVLRSVRIRRGPQGQYMARGDVNGRQIALLIDTGASTILLRPVDAEAAGIDLKSLNYSVPVETANGNARCAAVRLRSVAIGEIQVNDVEALVAEPGSLNESLLGMSFLRRLRSYEISGEFLTLRE